LGRRWKLVWGLIVESVKFEEVVSEV
jgi:hypothetical protein